MLTVTNANLGAAVRLSLFEKGLDPREFSMLSFGGAGGLHATDVAAEMGIAEVIFPREPGTLSAYGILYSDLVQDIARSRRDAGGAGKPGGGRRRCWPSCARPPMRGWPPMAWRPAARQIEVAVDMRYHGQAFELLVPWGDVAAPDAAALRALLGALPRDAPAALQLCRPAARRWRSSRSASSPPACCRSPMRRSRSRPTGRR